MTNKTYTELIAEAEDCIRRKSNSGAYIVYGKAAMACELEAITKAQFDAVFEILFDSKKQETRRCAG